MATFELTARHQMYLGNSNVIPKGERLTMNIHTMGVLPHTIFSNPESRRQAIQQFATKGIDLKSNSPFLNPGHWDIKRLPEFYKDSGETHDIPVTDINTPLNETKPFNEVIDDVDMKKGCISLVRDFYNEGLDLTYAERGLEGRCEIAMNFYDGVKQKMGIDTELTFSHMPPHKLGGFDAAVNRIELNSKFLENTDCEELLNTILHESRHAFQFKCVNSPDSVTVKNNIIDVWHDNFDNYIDAAYDFEAYENQEIEKDANYFADSVMKKGTDLNYV